MRLFNIISLWNVMMLCSLALLDLSRNCTYLILILLLRDVERASVLIFSSFDGMITPLVMMMMLLSDNSAKKTWQNLTYSRVNNRPKSW